MTYVRKPKAAYCAAQSIKHCERARVRGARVSSSIRERGSAIRTRPERLRLSSGKTACGTKPGQTHRRGWRLQAPSGFAAIGRAVPVPRNTPAPVPDADAMPAFCMHGINRKGLPAKTGKPFYLFRGGDGGNRSYRKLGFFRNLEGFAGKI